MYIYVYVLFYSLFFYAPRSHVFRTHPHSPSMLYQAQHHHPRSAHRLQSCSCELIKWDDLWPPVTDHYEANMYGPTVGKHWHRRRVSLQQKHSCFGKWHHFTQNKFQNDVLRQLKRQITIFWLLPPDICKVYKQQEKVVSLWLPFCLFVPSRSQSEFTDWPSANLWTTGSTGSRPSGLGSPANSPCCFRQNTNSVQT